MKNHFSFEIGLSYEGVMNETKNLLMKEGFSLADTNDLFYPNAIEYIAERSMIQEAEKRKTCKKSIL